jgi:hypothetical protein
VISTFALFLLVMLSCNTLMAQNPAYDFAKGIGGSGHDYGNAIAVDTYGDIYVTGTFAGTVDFDPGSGTANLTAAGGDDAFVARYDASGNYVWAFRLGGAGSGGDLGKSIAVDAGGNVYVAGGFASTTDFDPGSGTANLSPGSYATAFIARYNSSGGYVWAFRLGGTNAGTGVQSIAVDGSGNVVATGSFSGSIDFDPGSGSATLRGTQSSADIFVAKYSSSRGYLWAFAVGGSDYEIGRGVAVDGSGNVYVTGMFSGSFNFNPGSGTRATLTASGPDIFLAKYNASGRFLWAFRVGATSVRDEAVAVAADGNGNVVMTGAFQGTADFDPGSGTASLTPAGGADIFVARYSSTGSYLWAFRVGGSTYDGGSALAIDGSGNIYLAGCFSDTADFDPGSGTALLNRQPEDGEDMFVARYTSSGAYACAFNVDGTGESVGTSLAVDGSGNLCITGQFGGTADFDPGAGTANATSAGDADIFIARYTPTTLPKRSPSNVRHDNGLHVAPGPITDEIGFR